MSRKRFTNNLIHRRGDTTVVSARIPNEVVAFMDAAVGKPDLPNRGAVLQDACGLWAVLEEREADGTES